MQWRLAPDGEHQMISRGGGKSIGLPLEEHDRDLSRCQDRVGRRGILLLTVCVGAGGDVGQRFEYGTLQQDRQR